jgi:beta-N-acetylhexosaminidase
MSRRILNDLLRDEWAYRGVIITDGMDMHAIAGRFGVGLAAVKALVAGADMVMALGTPETQEETISAIAAALESGEFPMAQAEQRLARLAALAATYPCEPRPYIEDEADRAIMAHAWRLSLSARGNPARPPAGAKIRLVVRQDVVSDGVSEAGVPAHVVAAMLARRYEVETVTFADAETFDWSALPDDGRFVVLASTSRLRYGPNARGTWRPDLHLALWNPYQALDIESPALMTYGFAAPALDAIDAWLGGELEAKGRCPVPGFE